MPKCKPGFLFILLLIPFDMAAQTTVAKVNAISAVYNNVENDRSLRQVSLEAEQFLDHSCDNGCTLTGFFKGDSIVKISDWIGLSYGIIERSFYFNKGKLVFVNETERHFVRDSMGAPLYNKPPVVAFEGRYYFDGNTLIKETISGEKLGGEKETPTRLLVLGGRYTAIIRGRGN